MAEKTPLKYQNGQHTPFARGDTLPPEIIPSEGFARVFRTCAGAEHQPGNAIPTCEELDTAIELAIQTMLARIVAGPGIAITSGPGGTRIISNTCCDAKYQLLRIEPLVTPIVEGQAACWRIEVTPVVSGSDLPLTLGLSGTEQDLRSYPAPTGIVIPIGQTTVQVCVPTLDDGTVLGARILCLHVDAPHLQLGGSSCIDILDNDGAPPSTHTITTINVSPGYTVPEGTNVCFEIVLNSLVTGSPVTIPLSLSGDEQAINNYTIVSPLIVPIGQSRATVCVQTIDDAIDEPDRELALVLGTTARIPSFPGGRVPVTITDNDGPPGIPTGALSGDAGLCFAIDCTSPNPNVYSADLSIAPNGAIGGTAAGAGANWIGGSGANPADYEVRISGGLSQGPDPIEVWLNLGANRAWTRTLGCGTSATIGGTVRIRRISDQQLVVEEPYGGYQVYTGVNAVCP
jgi:hypothetical protein